MPLDRHPALEKLSEDHHLFLIQAQNIRWLLDGDKRATTSEDLVGSLLEFWNRDGKFHLQEEEEVTYPFYLQHAPLAKKEITALETDHMWIRDKFAELSNMPRFENTTPLLKSLGDYMISHIRQEEQIIYEDIQTTLSSEALAELAQKSAAFRKEHRGEDPEKSEKPKLPDTGLLNLKMSD